MSDHNAEFKIFQGGPLKVTGNFQIVDTRGKEIEIKGPVYLCRCGGSGNKPFCDGTHRTRKFSG